MEASIGSISEGTLSPKYKRGQRVQYTKHNSHLGILDATIATHGENTDYGIEYGIECDNGNWYRAREKELKPK